MTTPAALCAACLAPLYPHAARVTDRGYVHATCPPRTCGECPAILGPKAVSGLCKRCYGRLRIAGRIDPAEPRQTPSCARCGIPGDRWCDDCLDVLADLRELGRWVA